MMRPLTLALLTILCAILLVADPSSAERRSTASIRCRGRLLSAGVSKPEVREQCGQPSNIEAWQEQRLSLTYPHSDARYYRGYQLPSQVRRTVNVEEWMYNFGSTRFIVYLRFENGRLVSVANGSYGF